MHKSLALLIVLLLASGIFLRWSCNRLYDLRDQITITERTIIGDPATASSLNTGRAYNRSSYDYLVRPADDEPLALEWTE